MRGRRKDAPARTPKGAKAIPSSRTKGRISRSADLSMMEYMVWKIAKGVFPVLLAYSFARATAHEGAFETPYTTHFIVSTLV